jgi:hypothetical protein
MNIITSTKEKNQELSEREIVKLMGEERERLPGDVSPEFSAKG